MQDPLRLRVLQRSFTWFSPVDSKYEGALANSQGAGLGLPTIYDLSGVGGPGVAVLGDVGLS